MSVMRPDGVRKAMASAFPESFRASISRFKILPGWMALIV
jgi:hypothetical protein